MTESKIDVESAVKVLQDGGIVIFPTDTAFGIGCRIDNEKSIKKLFTIRKRPEDKATPVLVNSIQMAQRYLKPIKSDVKKLMEEYWPGGLTIILPCKSELVPELVRGKKDTLGVRLPNHPTTLALIKGVAVPILGPSANFAGGETPYRLSDIDKRLINLVDYVIDGETKYQTHSTVIDCSHKPWKVIREGIVKLRIENEHYTH